MPELPEVETVRRGLEPVMQGARFQIVEARRRDLRWPLPPDFVARLEGQTVTGLGRRAKYLTVDLSSGEVLLMHLGMSGSFRVVHNGGERKPGKYHHERPQQANHDHVVFHMSNGAEIAFNDPRRFGSMKLVRRDKLDQEPLLRALGPEPGGARQHLCLRGAVARAPFAQAPRLHPRDPHRRAERARARLGRGNPGRAQGCDRRRRLLAARPQAHRRRARPVPAPVRGLRPRRPALPPARLRRHHQAYRPDRALDFFLPGVPALTL
jgi:hypothetical protein